MHIENVIFLILSKNAYTKFSAVPGIALLFGIGNAFDSLVSAAAYVYLLKKQKINILCVGK